MTEDTHNVSGAGFVHLRELLPNPETIAAKTYERRGKGGRESQEFQDGNADYTNFTKAFGEEWVKGGAGGKRERRGVANDVTVDKRCGALVLAQQLHDERNLAFYKFVVRTLPEEIIRDALVRALDVPQRNIRRSRGALFASIMAPQLKARCRKRRRSSSTTT